MRDTFDITSACGRARITIDEWDYDEYMNSWGVGCCNECSSIIASRSAWMTATYQYIY